MDVECHHPRTCSVVPTRDWLSPINEVTSVRRFAAIALAFVLFAAASPSRSANEEASHSAHGIVKNVDAKAGTVTIDHEDIPGVMMAMTMTYAVADPAALQNVAVGQAVDFRIQKEGSHFVVTEINAGEEKAKEGSGGEMSCCGDGEGHDAMSGHHDMKQP